MLKQYNTQESEKVFHNVQVAMFSNGALSQNIAHMSSQTVTYCFKEITAQCCWCEGNLEKLMWTSVPAVRG